MKNIANTLKKRVTEIEQEKNAIIGGSGEMLTADQQQSFNDLTAEAAEIEKTLSMKAPRQTEPAPIGGIPAVPKRNNGLQCFSDEKTALNFARYAQALTGNRQAERVLLNEGIQIGAAMGEDINSAGGYLVPTEFARDIIRLVETRGVFRRESRIVQMSSDKLLIPRQTSGATAYFVGEADSITASDLTLSQVELALKKVGLITSFSSELAEDGLIAVGDLLGVDFAYRISDKEDECGFNGTGAAAYGGIVGVRQALIESSFLGVAADADADRAADASLVRYGTGYGYANIGLDDLTEMIGRLPDYAEAGAKWYMSIGLISHTA